MIITERGITGKEVAVEVMIGMNVIAIVGEIEIAAEAGAVVLVLTVQKAEEEVAMMMIGEVAVAQ